MIEVKVPQKRVKMYKRLRFLLNLAILPYKKHLFIKYGLRYIKYFLKIRSWDTLT
jgi:hypothetical protein